VTSAYRLFKQREIASDLKETVCRLSDSSYDDAANQNMPSMQYELPDGNVIDVGVERYKIPELLFQPELIGSFGLGGDAPDLKNAKGLSQLVLENINRCDVDVRKDLFGGMLLAGGGSLFPQLRERLEAELHDAAPTNVRVKVTASQNADREEIRHLDRRFHPRVSRVVPADVDEQAGVRGARRELGAPQVPVMRIHVMR
jgi:actin-like protein 6A